MDFLDKWRVSRDTREAEGKQERGKEDSDHEAQVDKPGGIGKDGEEAISKRIYQATYRNKNKDAINARRRDQEQEPVGAYKKARRRAKYKKQAWDITFDNWMNVWNSCPKVFDDSIEIYQHAWQMRSGDIQKGTQMRRLDTNKGWQVGNVAIYYRNQRVPEHGIVAPWDYTTNSPLESNETGREKPAYVV